MEDILLSSSITIAKYRELEEKLDQDKISDFVLERFTERYITPLRGGSGKKHGFCLMAISCLIIESLESFRQGLPHTKGESKKTFKSFFKWCSDQNYELRVFSELAEDFFDGVRCGILHQAETTRGWRINRTGLLFDSNKKLINATKFHNELETCLQRYCEKLKSANWDDEIWQNLRKKMKVIIKNCVQVGTV